MKITAASRKYKAIGATWGSLLSLAIGCAYALAPPVAMADETKPVLANDRIGISDPVPAGFKSWDEFLEVQVRLDQTADAIRDMAARPENPGFGSLIVSQMDKQLKLYWKGPVPVGVLDIAAHMPAGYSVRSFASPYTEAQLSDAATKAVQLLMKARVDVTSVAPLQDASGLQVGVPGDPRAAASELNDFAIPARVTNGDLSIEPTHGRLYDTPPYWGGARWYAYGNGTFPSPRCSTGFAIKYQKTGQTMMLTAGHCGSVGLEAFTKKTPGIEAYDHMGITFESKLPGSGVAGPDLMLIKTTVDSSNNVPMASDGYVYLGNGDPANDIGIPVAASIGVNVGDYVCTNGAASLALHCAGQVIATEATAKYPDNNVVNHAAVAKSIDGKDLAIHGDSGGPVLLPARYAFLAQGIISGMGGSASTGPLVVFTPIKYAESIYQSSIVAK